MGIDRRASAHHDLNSTSEPDDRPTASISLLGGFEYRLNSRSVPLSPNTQRLLTFLALQERPVTRQLIAGALWSGSSESRAAANLRSALWRLSQTSFQPARSVGPSLQLDGHVTVDLHEATAAARRLLDPTDRWCPSLPEAIDLGLTKDVLPDVDDDWVHAEQEAFRQLRFHALESLCLRLGKLGRFPEAIEAGIRAVEGEPLRESAHRVLISLHLAEGNVPEALRQYDQIRALLHDHLGLEPSTELKALVHRAYDEQSGSSRPRSSTGRPNAGGR
jgi:DNA-binding SARP family transcriptional activator